MNVSIGASVAASQAGAIQFKNGCRTLSCNQFMMLPQLATAIAISPSRMAYSNRLRTPPIVSEGVVVEQGQPWPHRLA